jgi:hypothetical protein
MCFWVDDNGGEWLGLTTQKARKPHRCGDCNREIVPGEMYTRASFVNDGRATSVPSCSQCFRTRKLIEAHELAEGCRAYEASPPWGGDDVREWLADRGLRYDAEDDALVSRE